MNDPHPTNEVNVSLAEVEPPGWLDRCERFCLLALERLGIRHWELSVLLCSDRFIHELNRRYRGQDRPTDVLSFRQEDGAGPFPEEGDLRAVGDIAISLQTMRRNAAEAGTPEEEELKRLLIHGILHLYGMDHPEPEEASEMLDRQERLIEDLEEERIF